MRSIVHRAAVVLLAFLWLATARGEDTYTIMKIGAETSGFGKTTTVEKKIGDELLYETAASQTTRLARLSTTIEVEQSNSVLEDSKGRIRKMSARLLFAKTAQEFEGVVDGDTMKVTATSNGAPRVSEVDWSDDIPGPREQCRRLASTHFEKGTEVVFYQFDFTIGEPFRSRFTFEGDESIDLPTGKKTLHRVHIVSDSSAVPPSTRWIDDAGESRRETIGMLGMDFDMLDATKEQYVAAGGSRGAEVFAQAMIHSNVRLEDPRSLVEITYRITPKSGDATLDLDEDDHQRWAVNPQTPDTPDKKERLLVVRTVTPQKGGAQKVGDAKAAKDLSDFVAPNGMIQSDDPEIAAFAKEAVGEETNAWKAAQKLERAVMEHIKKKDMGVGFASASETFASCEGDCSEHAVLLAAACRAVGIPARVAMGLVYVNMGNDAVFGGHAWCEVSIDGKWYGLDGTLGTGNADPTHIRMAAASLKNSAFAADFGGIMKYLGQIDVEIVASK